MNFNHLVKSVTPLFSSCLIAVFFFACNSSEKKLSSSKSLDSAGVSSSQLQAKLPHELLDSIDTAAVVFYNVENLFDTIDAPEKKDEDFLPDSKKEWNAKRYSDKLEKLAQVLTYNQSSNPLFIGLAEVENRFVVNDLLQTGRLKETLYRVAHFESPDVRGIDVAFAFDHKRFHMLHSQAIPVTLEDDPEFKTRDILYVKGVIYDSSEIHVFVNHWSSRRGGQEASEHKRIKAANLLRKSIDSILAIDRDANILIMGDFNDYPTNRSIVEVLNAKDKATSSQLVNLMIPYHDKGEGTHNYKGEWGALDQLIVSRSLIDNKGLEVVEKEAVIFYDEEFLYTKKDDSKTPNRTYGGNSYFGGYSDHLAIALYLFVK